jgi:PAS domain S-box-containing protein
MRTHELRKPVFIGIGMFLVLAILTQLLSYFWYQSARHEEMSRLLSRANGKKERLHVTLSNSLSCTQTLAFIIEEYGVPNDFDSLAEKLIKINPLVDAIELLRGGVITNVFPIDGNEAAIGYDILSDTIRHSGAVKAIRTHSFFFAGPVRLKQGGIAVIGRQPIFVDGKFWGFSAVLIRLSNFLNTTDISPSRDRDFIYQLARVHSTDGSEEFFIPFEDTFNKEDFVAVEIPNTEWRLYVGLANKSEAIFHATILSVFGFTLACIVGLFAWYIAAQPERLSRLVDERTRQLTMEKNLSDAIINSLPGIFYLYDKDRRFLRWNKSFEIVSGYSAAEISKMHPLDFFQGDDKKLLKERIDSVFEKGKADVEAQFYTKRKEKITYYFNGNVAYFENDIYLIGMGIDITKRVNAERDIRNLNTRLQSTIDRLQMRNNDLQQFSYVVSHNLRDPIAKIMGLASIFNADPGENQMIVDRIADAARNLDEVVRDISDIVSARNVDKKQEYISFDHELQLILHALEDDVKQSNVELIVDFNEAQGMISVRSYIHSVLYNLVSNAFKYRRHDIPFKLHIYTRKYENGIYLAVADNGIGIDLVKNGEKIFGLYKRFTSSAIPGKGIGLCMVKNQVESLGGRVEVASRLNEGSTFTVYLPVDNERSAID